MRDEGHWVTVFFAAVGPTSDRTLAGTSVIVDIKQRTVRLRGKK